MRIIKNIVNEYQCYKSCSLNVSKLNLNHDKLLALIFLKNLFPKEFDSFLKDEGEIIDILNDKILDKNTNKEKIDNYKLQNFMRFLINEGLIDQSYYLYKQIFHNGKFSSNDMHFIKQILENKDYRYLSFSQKLDNPEKIIERLDEYHFKREAVINESIFSTCVNLSHISNINSKLSIKKFPILDTI